MITVPFTGALEGLSEILDRKMMDLVKWFNENQGFALSVLTFAYVVCTGIIVFVMSKANTQAVDLERQRSRPIVIFDIELFPRYLLCATLKNIGLTAAYHVKVECEPALINEFRDEPSKLTTSEVEFLAPQRRIADVLADVGRHPREGEQPVEIVKGRVCYKDAEGNSYAEPFSIDLAQERRLVIFSEGQIVNEVRGISITLKNIARKLGVTH